MSAPPVPQDELHTVFNSLFRDEFGWTHVPVNTPNQPQSGDGFHVMRVTPSDSLLLPCAKDGQRFVHRFEIPVPGDDDDDDDESDDKRALSCIEHHTEHKKSEIPGAEYDLTLVRHDRPRLALRLGVGMPSCISRIVDKHNLSHGIPGIFDRTIVGNLKCSGNVFYYSFRLIGKTAKNVEELRALMKSTNDTPERLFKRVKKAMDLAHTAGYRWKDPISSEYFVHDPACNKLLIFPPELEWTETHASTKYLGHYQEHGQADAHSDEEWQCASIDETFANPSSPTCNRQSFFYFMLLLLYGKLPWSHYKKDSLVPMVVQKTAFHKTLHGSIPEEHERHHEKLMMWCRQNSQIPSQASDTLLQALTEFADDAFSKHYSHSHQ